MTSYGHCKNTTQQSGLLRRGTGPRALGPGFGPGPWALGAGPELGPWVRALGPGPRDRTAGPGPGPGRQARTAARGPGHKARSPGLEIWASGPGRRTLDLGPRKPARGPRILGLSLGFLQTFSFAVSGVVKFAEFFFSHHLQSSLNQFYLE